MDLYSQLQENRAKLEEEYQKEYAKRNTIKRLDEDDVEYLEKLDKDRKVRLVAIDEQIKQAFESSGKTRNDETSISEKKGNVARFPSKIVKYRPKKKMVKMVNMVGNGAKAGSNADRNMDDIEGDGDERRKSVGTRNISERRGSSGDRSGSNGDKLESNSDKSNNTNDKLDNNNDKLINTEKNSISKDSEVGTAGVHTADDYTTGTTDDSKETVESKTNKIPTPSNQSIISKNRQSSKKNLVENYSSSDSD